MKENVLPKIPQAIPMLIAAIPPKKEFTFELRIDPHFRNAPIPSFWKEVFAEGEQHLLGIVRNYTLRLLEKELEVLRYLRPEWTGELIRLYEEMRKVAFRHIFFRLGFGKTYFFNSIGCLLSPEELRKVISGRRVGDINAFPATRWVVKGKEPLGWLMVKKTGTP